MNTDQIQAAGIISGKPQEQTDEAPESLVNTAQDIHPEAAPLLSRAVGEASALAQRGLAAVCNSSHQLRDKAQHASASTVGCVREKPVRSMLLAGAIGAALMGIVGLFRRSRNPG